MNESLNLESTRPEVVHEIVYDIPEVHWTVSRFGNPEQRCVPTQLVIQAIQFPSKHKETFGKLTKAVKAAFYGYFLDEDGNHCVFNEDRELVPADGHEPAYLAEFSPKWGIDLSVPRESRTSEKSLVISPKSNVPQKYFTYVDPQTGEVKTSNRKVVDDAAVPNAVQLVRAAIHRVAETEPGILEFIPTMKDPAFMRRDSERDESLPTPASVSAALSDEDEDPLA